MPKTKQIYKRTAKQREATKILASAPDAALYGGSRSGKTAIICRSIIIRASKVKSRHLIARFAFNHVKTSIWYDTMPKVLSMFFPDLPIVANKSDWFWTLPNGSEIWLGGVDDKERVEKILGNEYSTIYLNEASQISYDAVTMLQTRLAENNGLDLRMWYDFNPPTKKHWTYRYFVEGLDPVSLKPLKSKIPYLVMNPSDNRENLPKSYFDRLDRLPKKQRDRFMEGKFTLDVEGALWDYEMIIAAQAKPPIFEPSRTVIGVDPAVTNNADSDETGIVVASTDASGREIRIEADYTCKASTQTWATRVINAYEKHNADALVVETNQGGDLVENVLRLNNFKGRIIKVHAKKGKALRAEPIVALYEQGLVGHAEGLDDLESEMMEWVPMNTKDSPNRIDACLAAGSMVHTGSGLVPIECIKAGDKVLTRKGYFNVSWAGMTKKKSETMVLGFSNGASITLTHDHPVYVEGKGWMRADALCYGDCVSTTPGGGVKHCGMNRLSFAEKFTGGTQGRSIERAGVTSLTRSQGLCRSFTELSGFIIMAQSLTATMFTTLTATLSTTTYRTLLVLAGKNMPESTQALAAKSSASILKKSGRSLQIGIDQKKAPSGIGSRVESLGRAVRRNTRRVALAAARFLNPTGLMQGAAQGRAFRDTQGKAKSMMFTCLALLAGLLSGKTNTPKCLRHAPVRVVLKTEGKEQPVYNLHVDGPHEFYANGVLVHNCVYAATELCRDSESLDDLFNLAIGANS